MAFDYTTFKTQIGKLLGGLNETNAFRETVSVRVTTLLGQFTSTFQADVTDVYTAQTNARSSQSGWITYLATLAQRAIARGLNNDLPFGDSTLNGQIAELARRMTRDAQTFNACPASGVVAAVGSPAGNPTVVFTTYEYTGQKSDYVVPDVYTMKVTADRSQGGSQYAESYSVVGKPADSLPTDASYPSGSGVSAGGTFRNPATDGGLVSDGGAWAVSGAGFSKWTIAGGTWNVSVFQVGDDPRDGASGFALRLKGDGATVLKVRQQISPAASTVYTLHARLKKVADPGTDWAVSFILVDGSGNTIAGPGTFGNDVLSSVACSSLTADWLNTVTGTFVTPAVLPATGVFLEIRLHQSGSLTTAAVANAEAYVDHVAVHGVSQLYAGGPAVNAYSGTLESIVGDTRTITVTLDTGVVTTYVIRGLDRVLRLAALTPRLPTSGAPTISDAVIS